MPTLTRTVDMDSHKGAFEPENPGENAEHSGEPQQASLLDQDEEELVNARKVTGNKRTGKRKRS